MPTTFRPSYGTTTAVTITLASLATDSTLLTGREAAAVDNSTLLAEDLIVEGKVTTGTGPTTGKTIEVWAFGSGDGTNWPGGFTGSNAAKTVASTGEKYRSTRPVARVETSSTSDVTYSFGPVSLRQLFGGVLPRKISFFVTHDTAVNLNATGSNQEIKVTPVNTQGVAS